MDDITDAVEDVFLQIYMCNVDTIREGVCEHAADIVNTVIMKNS